MLRTLIAYLRTGLALFFTALCGSLAMLSHPFFGARGVRYFSRWWGRLVLWAVDVHVVVRGADKLDPNQPYVFTSNHQSGLDIPILIGYLPQFPHFVAKMELKRAPFIGFALKYAGHIFIDRSDKRGSLDTLKQAGGEVRAGKSVAVFPEGTRFPPRVLGPFRRGAFVLARAAQVPIVPVGIVGSAERTTARRFYTRPGVVGMLIGEPIPPAKFGPDNDALADRIRTAVHTLAGPSAARTRD